MILCFYSFRYLIKILVGVLLQRKIRSQVLKLAHVDSKARASRSHQVLKKSLALWIKVLDQVKEKKKIFKRRFSEDLCHGCKCKHLFLDKI